MWKNALGVPKKILDYKISESLDCCIWTPHRYTTSHDDKVYKETDKTVNLSQEDSSQMENYLIFGRSLGIISEKKLYLAAISLIQIKWIQLKFIYYKLFLYKKRSRSNQFYRKKHYKP